MKIRTRLFLAFVLVMGFGFYLLVDWILDDLRPRYLETMEESMIDMATVLSSLAATQLAEEQVQTDDLRAAFGDAQKRRFSARIYDVTKTQIAMRVYITDRTGIVVFDSDNGRDEGKDYSRWNDVARTLRGEYGARATRSDPDEPMSSLLCVASPIKRDDEIVGVLTVCRPSESVRLFVEGARKKIVWAGIAAAFAVAALGMVFSYWITGPIEELTEYAKAVRDGRRAPLPRLGRSEIGTLGDAFEEMRAALEGKQYVENYVQNLTHEMKSPLSAIRGAAELLNEDMPPEQRKRFLDNLRSESTRIQDLVERMLELSAIENRRALRDIEEIDLTELVSDVVTSMTPVLSAGRIRVAVTNGNPVVVAGERFLIRQALSNLVQNAVEFAPPDSEVSVSIAENNERAEVVISDIGPGIPEYALDKVFERFYSLRRPSTGVKSSGLGLVFAKEAAELHGGAITLANRPEGGAKATLVLPKTPPQRRS